MKIALDDSFYLSEFQPDDKPALLEFLADPEIHKLTLRLPFPYTADHADWWLAHVAASERQQGQATDWAVREAQGRLIGGIGFHDLEIGKSHQAEIGYWLARPYWSRGITTKAVRALCRFAFMHFGLEKITAHVFEENKPSMRVLQKCGFEQEGYLKRHYLKHGRLHDARLYSLFREQGPAS